MIRPCENWRMLEERLPQFGAFGVKAACTLAAYEGPAAFLQVFETHCGAALLFEGELILCGDGEELRQFALLCPGVRSVLCREDTAGGLPLAALHRGAIMVGEGAAEGFPAQPELKELYDCIRTVFGLPDVDNSLYVDLSHRLRHGASDALYRDGGCALVHHSRSGSLLTALGVKKQQRGKGVGTALAREALRCTAGPLWLFCEEGLVRMYEKVGFEKQGGYNLLERKG